VLERLQDYGFGRANLQKPNRPVMPPDSGQGCALMSS
jgi:hypothetical protein